MGVAIEFFGGFTMRNSLVWSNNTDIVLGGMPISIDYCAGNIPLSAGGQGNVIGNPIVWEAAGFRHFLRAGSPCIDAGDPASPTDPDGSRADIGAIVFDVAFAPPPTGYCQAKINSLGCLPAINSQGSASQSGSSFSISCANVVNQKVGLLFYGLAGSSAPFSGGTLCVAPPLKRTLAMSSGGNVGVNDCSGAYAFDFNAQIQSGLDPRLRAGALVFAQFWGRDPAASFGTSLSNSLLFGIAP